MSMPIIRSFSTMRLRLRGPRLPIFAARPRKYPFDAHRAFLQHVYGGAPDPADYTPPRIVNDFNNSPALFTGTASFVAEMIENARAQLPHVQQDPASWSVADRRIVVADAQANQDGHYIYSGAFEQNPRSGIAADPRAALHFISTFPAGGGYLLPPSLYPNILAEAWRRRGFPSTVLADNAQAIRDYTAKVYQEGRLLTNEIVILGKNVVRIKDHVITQHQGINMQFLRPEALAHHIFYSGHAIWAAAEHPALAGRSFHGYFGHGQSNVSLGVYLGDALNVGSGVVTFKDAFRAGVITYAEFQALRDQFGDAAYALSLDGRVAIAVDGLLQAADPGLLWDRKLLTLLDSSPGADAIRFFNPYTPPGCSEVPRVMSRAAAPAAAGGVGGDECDIFDVDLEDFIEKTKDKEMVTEEDFLAIIETYPTTAAGEELVQADGSPFTVDSFSEMMSMDHTPEYDVFAQEPGDLLGAPVDDAIVAEVRQSLDQWLDWSEVRTSMDTAIADQVNQLVDATDPFADGSAVGAIADRFTTMEFRDGVSQHLTRTLSEALGPHAASFASLLGQVSLFKSVPPEDRALLLDRYPLVDALASQVFTGMSAVGESGTSYLDAQTLVSVIDSKKAYFEDPAQKTGAQRAITAQVTDLGDVSQLQPDLARTVGEIDSTRQSLTSVNERLLQTPDDPDLQRQRDELQRHIDEEMQHQYDLERKQEEADALERAQAETDGQTLDHEGTDARHDRDTTGDHVFEHGK